MTIAAISILLISWIVSFIGSLPFGPLNLIMIDTTLKNSLRAGGWFAVAAATVEIGQSLVALYGSAFIQKVTEQGHWFNIFSFIVFVIMGIVFFFRKDSEAPNAQQQFNDKHFLKGLVIALLNPQTIVFWVIVLALLQSEHLMSVQAHSPLLEVLAFLTGAALGKFCALLLFGVLSQRIVYRMALVGNHLNHIIGIILIAIGMFQGILALAI